MDRHRASQGEADGDPHGAQAPPFSDPSDGSRGKWLRTAAKKGTALVAERIDSDTWIVTVALQPGQTPHTAQRAWAQEPGFVARGMYADRFVASRHARILVFRMPSNAVNAVAAALEQDTKDARPEKISFTIVVIVQCFFILFFFCVLFCEKTVRQGRFSNTDKRSTNGATVWLLRSTDATKYKALEPEAPGVFVLLRN